MRPPARTMMASVALVGMIAAARADEPRGRGFADVRVVSRDCTTEPAPRTRLRARRAGPGRAKVEILGEGDLCLASWGAHVAGGTIDLQATEPDAAGACGTCLVTLELSDLPEGRHEVRFDGARAAVTVH